MSKNKVLSKLSFWTKIVGLEQCVLELTSDTTVWDQYIFVIGRLVPRMHVVDLGIDTDILAAVEDFGLHCRILLHQTVHIHFHFTVICLLNTEQYFVFGVIQCKKGFQVLEKRRIRSVDQRLENAHSGQRFFRELG